MLAGAAAVALALSAGSAAANAERKNGTPAPRAQTQTQTVPIARPQPAAGGPALQLGLFQREGEAWITWQQLQRRNPELAGSLTPAVVPLDPRNTAAGVALRAVPAANADAAALCRRVLGTGLGCLVVDHTPPSAPSAPGAAPSAPLPGKRPEPAAPARTATVPVPLPPAAVQPAVQPAAQPVPVPPPAAPAQEPAAGNAPPLAFAAAPSAPAAVLTSAEPSADGFIPYNEEDVRTLVEIERRSRRAGRLGAVLPGTKLEITPAVLQRGNWNLCALTFDDGPHRTVTRQILDILNAEGIKATYFPVGKVAMQNPEIIRDFVAAGHEIGNHSHTHPNLRPLPPEAQRFEIAEANRALRSIGANPVLFRPPYGRYTLEMLAIAREEQMSPVLWNVDTRDWQVRDPDKIVQHVKTEAGTGSVLLLHSTYPSTASALPRVISDLRAKGCEFVTLSQWIESMKQLASPMMVNAAEPVVSADAPIGVARP